MNIFVYEMVQIIGIFNLSQNLPFKKNISRFSACLAWYAEFLLEIDLKILLRKTGARLIFKIALISLHFDPGL
jgi:hypothetical protein